MCDGQASGAKLRARWVLQCLTLGRTERVNPLTFQNAGVVFPTSLPLRLLEMVLW